MKKNRAGRRYYNYNHCQYIPTTPASNVYLPDQTLYILIKFSINLKEALLRFQYF